VVKLLLHPGPTIPRRSCNHQQQSLSSTLITGFEEEIWRTITIMDSFSFVTSGALEIPVNVKMSVVPHLLLSCSILTILCRRGALKGTKHLYPFLPYYNTLSFVISDSIKGTVSSRPGIPIANLNVVHTQIFTLPYSSGLTQSRSLYQFRQLISRSRPLERTTFDTPHASSLTKASHRWNEWLELPITISTIPATSQLAITVWDISPTGTDAAQGHAVPFGDHDSALR
jgi:hypothetical protein